MNVFPRPRASLLPMAGWLAIALSVGLHGAAIAAAGITYHRADTASAPAHGAPLRVLTIAVDNAPPIAVPSRPTCEPVTPPAPIPEPPPPARRAIAVPPATVSSAPAPAAQPLARQLPDGAHLPSIVAAPGDAAEGMPAGGAGAASSGAGIGPALAPAPRPAPVPPPPTRAQIDGWMAEYGRAVYGRVAAAVVYPDQAARERREGVVMVQLTIDARGRLVAAAITGNADALLAAGALAAVRRAAPYPAPPSHLAKAAGPSLTFRLPLRFFLAR